MSEQSTYAESTSSRTTPAAVKDSSGKTEQACVDRAVVFPSVQTKLTVSAPDDPYEKEADATASQVMRFPATFPGITSNVPEGRTQAKCAECEKEEELHRKPGQAFLQRQITPFTQRKTDIQRQEEEESVQAKAENFLQRQEEEEEPVQARSEPGLLQRQEEDGPPEEEEGSLQAKPEKLVQRQEEEETRLKPEEEEASVQAKTLARPGMRNPAKRNFVNALHNSKGRGIPLPASTRDFMEQGFGADFSGVRIHTDMEAMQMSRDIHAQAFTHGADIYFNEGKYAPESMEGGHLLAHELTHTVQQGASPLVERPAAASQVPLNGSAPDTQPDPPLQLQAKADGTLKLAPQLLEAVQKARAEIGKVDAKKVDEDGTRHGWQRLWEYFRTAFGKNKTVSEEVVKYIKKSGGSDAMPSWCGIFIWWAYKKSGVDVPDWRFGGGQVRELDVFPQSRIPQPGDIAYRNEKSHYAIVSDVTNVPEGSKRNEWKVTTINGNTTGTNNLGGQVEEKTEPIGGRWHAFFNPATGMDLPTVPVKVSDLKKPVPGTGIASPEPEKKDEKQEKEKEKEVRPKEKELAAGQDAEALDPAAIGEESLDLEGDPGLKKPAGGMEEAAKVEAIKFKGPSEDMATGFSEASPSQMAASYAQMGDAVGGQLSEEKTETQESLPDLNASNTGVEAQLSKKETLPGDEGAKEIADMEGEGGASETGFEPHVFATPPPSNKEEINRKERDMGEDFWEWITSDFFGTIKTTDPDLDTSAGERPNIDTSGEADPGRSDVQKTDADKQISDKKKQTEQQIKDNPGQDRIKPALVDEKYPVRLGKDKPSPLNTPEEETLGNYAQAVLPAEVRDAADKKLSVGLDAKMAKQRTEITAAADTRDTSKKKSIEDAEKETAGLNKESTKEQVKAVKDNRAKVVADQQKGIREVQDKMKTYQEEAVKEQAGVDKEVDDKILNDNEEAGKKLDKAEEDAVKKKEEGTKEAEKIRKEEEKKNEDRSWWDWAKDAIKSAVKFVTEAIDAVFDKIRKAVKDLIDAAKKAALALIEAGRKWIVDKLNKFRDWLKEKVSKYLENFPGIRDAINGAIDKTVDFAVDTVNKTADALKKGVEWVADNLAKAIDSVLSKFQAGLKAAVGIMGAILTGDLAEALKIAFMAACEIAGVDPNPILGFLNRVKESLLDIFKAPLKFISNVGRGIQGGLSQFFANIKKHLIGGVISWLTGALSEVPIKLPDTWDVKGIFYLIAQILGVTYENVRAKVIKRLGPKGAVIIETIEKTADFVIALVTKGPIAIWDMIKEKIGSLKEMVIAELSKWLTITVIKEGIIWLLSLTNPASALVKAVKMLFDVVMFLVERFQQIKDFVMSVYNTLVEIVNGNVQKVSDSVEHALARTVPVVIGLLASVIGLGGIGKTVTTILKKVRKPIDKAMDFVIDKIVKFGRKLLKAVVGGTKNAGRKIKEGAKKLKDKVVQWWKARKGFTTKEGKKHELFLRKSGSGATLMIASKKETFAQYIGRQKVDAGDPKRSQKEAAKAKADGLAADIDKLIAKPDIRKEGSDTRLQEEVLLLLNKLADQTAILGFGEDTPDVISVIEYGSLTAEGGGTFMNARILSKNHPAGSTPQDAPPIWQKANRRKTTSVFIKGHLLNHNIGGPGYAYNLTPITGNGARQGAGYANNMHLNTVEKYIKPLVNKGVVLRYKVTVRYGKHADRTFQQELRNRIGTPAEQPADPKKLEIMDYEQNNLARSLNTQWAILKYENGKWVDDEVQTPISVLSMLPRGDFEIK